MGEKPVLTSFLDCKRTDRTSPNWFSYGLHHLALRSELVPVPVNPLWGGKTRLNWTLKHYSPSMLIGGCGVVYCPGVDGK